MTSPIFKKIKIPKDGLREYTNSEEIRSSVDKESGRVIKEINGKKYVVVSSTRRTFSELMNEYLNQKGQE